MDAKLFILCLCVGLGYSITVETSPDKIVASVTKEASISCVVDDVGGDVKLVRSIAIMKAGELLAFVGRCQQAECAISSASNIKAEGAVVDGAASQSSLKATIASPVVNDTGAYECSMFYASQQDLVEEDKAEANLEVEELSVDAMEPMLQDLKQRVEQLEADAKAKAVAPSGGSSGSCVAAFSVSNDKEYLAARSTVLRLPKVIMTKGNAYNVQSGIFTAPCKGLYAFHLTLALAGKASGTIVQVRKNKDVLFRIYAADKSYDDQTAGSTVIDLEKGDTVHALIEAASGARKYDNRHYTVFTGYLVQETPSAS